ncbi:PEP-CTERM sorting domain-containing protein [Pseudoduganella namucuonensis]|uniref:PEP-CTERM protein-sorting domain-containing protein n=1 Tax=Pseudoduganella namucuonensis TaxID=1035707 RepID=A0A1I7GGB0_9BURK|nr:PEP-CTERM sorting domain-containing protein [Pseudoduganella namucuonensis]SFU47480.1 PEP-CTERM protein-sorting domain-containing protein [Pseudoduganella namucuonensis]
MKLIKKLMLGAVAALSMTAAQAATINMGGVFWDPDVNDFKAASLAIRQTILQPSGELTGWGYINQLNNKGPSVFCPACELTFQFSGFMPVTSGFLPTTAGTAIGYTGGTINVYVHTLPTSIDIFDPATMTSANTGAGSGTSLWLQLKGHNFGGTTFSGDIVTDNMGNVTLLKGGGQLDASGGMAKNQFDTNTKSDFSDMVFSVSFTDMVVPNNPLDAFGTGNFNGDTKVPEPGSLGLIGLGLLGAAMVRRRKA